MAPARPMLLRRRLATAAMIGVVLYVVVDVILQFLPPYYSPISEAESNLAVGPYGWVMNLNFLARAVLSGCAIGALALSGNPGRLRTTGLVLFGVAGILSGLLAFFPTDVEAEPSASVGGEADVAGLSSAALATTTGAGAVHLVLATAGFLAALAAFALLTVWLRSAGELRRAYPLAVGFLLLAIAGIVFLGVSIVAAPDVLGLAERICLAGILGWVFAVCGVVRASPGHALPDGAPATTVSL
ncbi:uncharacterized protein DUF998 [Glaciihabitans tibetensis]|uniref:Uncharacterized protein DUF998 n=1 Tax=Glaciihabitans tibetensis TaxID=1266600 RepID=A0A2T0VFP7_9MICO|nr:DUF998 domain-containing protein [Glaciihabitans tibetensis]PRY69030.1 uncharacterized protein DUF998 [Glaciihabitans tibetensis]